MALLLGFFQLQGRARVQLREGQDLGALKSGGRASGLPRTLRVLETCRHQRLLVQTLEERH